MPARMTNKTTPSLTPTKMELVVALSRMPRTRITVTTSVMNSDGKLNQPPAWENGSLQSWAGSCVLKRVFSNSLRYFDHDEATQEQAIAYSRTRFQPMIQANNSPSVV